MRRWVVLAMVVVAIVLGALKACDSGSGGYVEPVPALIAARADGERLEIWTGTPCEGVTEIVLVLDPGAPDPLARVEYVAREPQALDRFDLGTPPEGFTARVPLPEGVSWRDAEDVSVTFTLADGQRSAGVDLNALADAADSAETGPDDYLLGDQVRTDDEVLEGDGDDYALVCSPDPTAE